MTDRLLINKCGYQDLMKLPGIGTKLAKAICQHRESKGNLTPETFAEIAHVRYDELKDLVAFDPHQVGDRDTRMEELQRELQSLEEEQSFIHRKNVMADIAAQAQGFGKDDMEYWRTRAIQSEAQNKLEKSRQQSEIWANRHIENRQMERSRNADDRSQHRKERDKFATSNSPNTEGDMYESRQGDMYESRHRSMSEYGSTPSVKLEEGEWEYESTSTSRSGLGFSKIPTGRPDTDIKYERREEPGTEYGARRRSDDYSRREYKSGPRHTDWGTTRDRSPSQEHTRGYPRTEYADIRYAPAFPKATTPAFPKATTPAFPKATTPQYLTAQGETEHNKKMVNIPKTLTYDGRNSWQAFYAKFSKYAEVQGWSENECKDYLCWCLEGKASEFYALLIERNTKIDFFDLATKLEKRFGFKDLPETAHIQFMQARQLPQESLDEWADKVLTLATRAFQSLPDEHMYQQAVMRFCQGSMDKEAGQHAANLRPKTIEEAIDRIRWFQHTNQAIYGRQSRREIKYISSDSEVENSPVRVRVATQAKASMESRMTIVESQLSDINKNVEKLVAGFQKCVSMGSTPRRSYSRSPSPTRSSNCYKCGGIGHFKRDCPANDTANKAALSKTVTFKEESLNGRGSTNEA
ncbi:MAG: helix-hairpin-helix domain-containing protein [Sedimenticola sp.]